MKTVFADSFYFFALINARDPAHARACEFLNSFAGSLVTAGWVLTELGDILCHASNRVAFRKTLDGLRANPNITIVDCDSAFFDLGVDLFNRRPDKDWSLTDCISFVVKEHAGIRDALTGDHHFEQAGFAILLG